METNLVKSNTFNSFRILKTNLVYINTFNSFRILKNQEQNRSNKYQIFVTPYEETSLVPPLHWAYLNRHLFLCWKNGTPVTFPDFNNHTEIVYWIENLVHHEFKPETIEEHNQWLNYVRNTYNLEDLPLGWDLMRNDVIHLITDSQCQRFAETNLIIHDFLRKWPLISEFIEENSPVIVQREDLKKIYDKLREMGFFK